MFPFSLDGLREKKKHFLLFFLVLEREIERGARPVNATEALDIIKWEKRKRERGLGHDQKSSLLSRSSFARSTAMNLHKVSPPPFFKILKFFFRNAVVWESVGRGARERPSFDRYYSRRLRRASPKKKVTPCPSVSPMNDACTKKKKMGKQMRGREDGVSSFGKQFRRK